MFKRRDIPPVLLLLLLIILVMLTLSQILVVHNGRYGRNIHNMRKLQLELREMDINLHSLMMQNVPSIELNRRMLQNEINAKRIELILQEASKPDIDRTRALKRVSAVGNNNGNSDDSNNKTHIEPTKWRTTMQGVDHTVDIGDSIQKHHVNMSDVSSRTPRNINRTISAVTHRLTNLLDHVQSERRELHSISETESTSSWSAGSTTGSRGGSVGGRSAGSSGRRTDVPRTSNITSPTRNILHYCPSVPPNLKGRVFVNFEHSHNYSEADIVKQNPELQPGGRWRPDPRVCTARHKVAVIIPYRDRLEHLTILLSHIHPILQRQQLDYTVIVVEQYGHDTFNKARIMNIAFIEALKMYRYQCFIFHDVDLVPEDDRNMYSCPPQPRHMSVAIDEMGYKLAYQELVGGVLNMRTEHFQRVNGYSNLYWGWGAEDDDMAYRIMHVGLKITRPPDGVARYKMVKHRKRKPADWRKRAKLLYTGTRRFQFDGLNSLQYKVVHIENRGLYTHILVDIGKPPGGF